MFSTVLSFLCVLLSFQSIALLSIARCVGNAPEAPRHAPPAGPHPPLFPDEQHPAQQRAPAPPGGRLLFPQTFFPPGARKKYPGGCEALLSSHLRKRQQRVPSSAVPRASEQKDRLVSRK